jgi:hypothetical protein
MVCATYVQHATLQLIKHACTDRQMDAPIVFALDGWGSFSSFKSAKDREIHCAHVRFCYAYIQDYLSTVDSQAQPYEIRKQEQLNHIQNVPIGRLSSATRDLVTRFDQGAQLSAVRLRIALLCMEKQATVQTDAWEHRIASLPFLCPKIIGMCTESSALRQMTGGWPGADATGNDLGSSNPVPIDAAVANLLAYTKRIPKSLRPYVDRNAEGRLDGVMLVIPRRDVLANILFHFVPDESVRLQRLESLLTKLSAPQQWGQSPTPDRVELRAAALDVFSFSEMKLPEGVHAESEWIDSEAALVAPSHHGPYTHRALRWAQNTQLL